MASIDSGFGAPAPALFQVADRPGAEAGQIGEFPLGPAGVLAQITQQITETEFPGRGHRRILRTTAGQGGRSV